MGRKADNLVGFHFGYLEVLKKSDHKDASRHAYWTCRCERCGSIKNIRSDNLWSGRSTTCGYCELRKSLL